MLESTRWSVNEYRASLQAASQVGDWRGARRLLTHMQAEGGHPPDAAAAAHAIGACHRAKRPKEVLELLQSLEEAGVTPELRSYNMGISASGRVGDWRTAIELLRSMGLNDVPPSVVSYNAALSALGRGGRWQQALELLEEMDRKRGVEADGARRRAIRPRAIRPRNSAAQFCRAIPAQFSHRPSIASTVISYSTTITACQKGGASEEAVRLLEKMQAMQAEEAKQAAAGTTAEPGGRYKPPPVAPNAYSYTAAMSALSDAGKWEDALKTFEQAPPEMQQSEALVNAAVSAAAAGKQWRRCVELIRNLRAAGKTPQSSSFNMAIGACAAAQQPASALACCGRCGRRASAARY